MCEYPGFPSFHTDLFKELTDPIQIFFWIKYRPFTDPVMYEITDLVNQICNFSLLPNNWEIRRSIIEHLSIKLIKWHSFLKPEQDWWQLLIPTNRQFFGFVSLINEKYQFYRPFYTNTDLLQTQKGQKVCITDLGL